MMELNIERGGTDIAVMIPKATSKPAAVTLLTCFDTENI
jgi:hypothetical protein